MKMMLVQRTLFSFSHFCLVTIAKVSLTNVLWKGPFVTLKPQFVSWQAHFRSWLAIYLDDCSHNVYHGRHTICMIAVTVSIMAGILYV